MKKFILFLFATLISVASMAQAEPSLSLFSTAQQAQIKAHDRWQGKKSADSVKTTIISSFVTTTKGTADSLVNFAALYKALQAKDDALTKTDATLKDRNDSAAIVLKGFTSIISTIQGGYVTKSTTDAINASVQAAQAKLNTTADLAAAIKAWMDKMKEASK